MDLLRSEVAARPEEKTQDFALGGMYGTKGFFFQQRRGHLNLRGFAALDLEKLVREVDVDLLQLHIENITFCNLREEDLRYMTDPQVIKLFKITQLTIEYLLYSQDTLVTNLNDLSKKYTSKKRSLAQKRRELAELEETSKHLRGQVKAKKQNIATLEDLLKETNKARERDLMKLKHKVDTSDQDSSKHPSIVTLFIAGPEGLCVELNERADCSVLQVQKEATKAFITRKQRESSTKRLYVKLVHKGKLLQPENSLRESGINCGDTVLAIVEQGEEDAEHVRQAPAPVISEAPTPSAQEKNTELIDFLAKEQQTMRQFAADFQQSLKDLVSAQANATGSGSSNMEAELVERLDKKWSGFEHGMRDQLEAKLLEYQSLLAAQQASRANQQEAPVQPVQNTVYVERRRGTNLGDLQDDTDGPDLGEIYNKLSRSATHIDILENKNETSQAVIAELIEARNRHEEQIRELRKERRQAAPTAAPQPVEVEKPRASAEKKVKTLEGSVASVPLRDNKWNNLPNLPSLIPASAAGAQEEAPARHSVTQKEAFEVLAVKPQKPEAVPERKPVPKPKQQEQPEPLAPKKEEPPSMVDIKFPLSLNRDLQAITHKDLVVTVPAGLSADELIFEVRKHVANVAKVSLPKVLLKLGHTPLFMQLDLPPRVSANFNAKLMAQLSLKGELIVTIPNGTPLTNAQIDILTASFERSVMADARRAADSGPGESGGELGAGNKAADALSASTGLTGSELDGKRGQLKLFSAAGSTKFKKRRDWDDEYDQEEEKLVARLQEQGVGRDVSESGISSEAGFLSANRPNEMYRSVRHSLERALGGVSDREGLTDEEMKEKLSDLKTLKNSLPEQVTEHITHFRGQVAGAVAAAAIDSGSESASGSATEGGGPANGLLTSRRSRRGIDWTRAGNVASSTASLGSTLRSSIVLSPSLRSSGTYEPSPNRGQLTRAFSTASPDPSTKQRRSIADFENEPGLQGRLSEDSPVLASMSMPPFKSAPRPEVRTATAAPAASAAAPALEQGSQNTSAPALLNSSLGTGGEENASAATQSSSSLDTTGNPKERRDRYAKPPRRVAVNALESDEEDSDEEAASVPVAGSTGADPKPTGTRAPELTLGAEVEADFYGQGTYCRGKIKRVRDNETFDILYEDGEVEVQVPGNRVRLNIIAATSAVRPPVTQHARMWNEGARIEVNFRGKYLPGTITRERNDGTFDVVYDDGEREQGVDKDLMRLLAPSDTAGGYNPSNLGRGNHEDRFASTTSTMESVDDSALTGIDDGDSYFKPGTGTIDMSSTIDTEGDNLLPARERGPDSKAGPKASSVALAADKYEQQASALAREQGSMPTQLGDKAQPPSATKVRRGSGSKATAGAGIGGGGATGGDTASVATLSPFRGLASAESDNEGDDFEASINSLALSDSHNHDDEVMNFSDTR